MYESFYGLKTKPFQLNPDPAFYFGSKQHSRARAYLEYGMHQNEGFIVITGDVGAGKTTMVRGLLDALDDTKVVAANLVSTQVDAEDTLRLIATAFGLRARDVSKSDLLATLEAFLLSAAKDGKRCLLIVDEAQNLSQRAVEELRMLSNFQIGNRALLQSFLVGQPEFRDILQSPHMLQLRQRVIASCHIGPLMKDEIQGYVEHRLKFAGWEGESLFDVDAYEAIYRVAGGIPRRINTVCDRVLLMGFLCNRKKFSVQDIEDVAQEVLEETSGVGGMAGRSGGRDDSAAYAAAGRDLDIDFANLDLGSLDLDLDQSGSLLSALAGGQVAERILRVERSLLRMEHLNSAILLLLQQLVAGLKAQSKSVKEEA